MLIKIYNIVSISVFETILLYLLLFLIKKKKKKKKKKKQLVNTSYIKVVMHHAVGNR